MTHVNLILINFSVLVSLAIKSVSVIALDMTGGMVPPIIELPIISEIEILLNKTNINMIDNVSFSNIFFYILRRLLLPSLERETFV